MPLCRIISVSDLELLEELHHTSQSEFTDHGGEAGLLNLGRGHFFVAHRVDASPAYQEPRDLSYGLAEASSFRAVALGRSFRTSAINRSTWSTSTGMSFESFSRPSLVTR